MTQPDYPFHPLANTLPLLEGAEFDELVASIRTHGQRDAITLYDGHILDGRNRYLACKAAGIKPLYEVLDPEDGLPPTEEMLAAYVYDRNVLRRQLTESQRAVAVAKLLRYGNLARNEDTYNSLAAKADVSRRTMIDADAVVTRGSDNVISLVERGEASVSRAAAVVRGKIPEDDLVPKPRATCGRPVGNTHVQRLRNVMEAFDALKAGKIARGDTVAAVIVRNWPGDPAGTKKIGEMASWLRSLARELEEVERNVAGQPTAVA